MAINVEYSSFTITLSQFDVADYWTILGPFASNTNQLASPLQCVQANSAFYP